MIRGLITPAAPKSLASSLRYESINKITGAGNPSGVRDAFPSFTVFSPSEYHPHVAPSQCECERDGGRARRVREPTPHERWRRLIVVNKRSWRVAGVEEHSSVDRPRRRRSRSLRPGIAPHTASRHSTTSTWCAEGCTPVSKSVRNFQLFIPSIHFAVFGTFSEFTSIFAKSLS